MLTDRQVIEHLWQTGHFCNPAFPNTFNIREQDLPILKITDGAVIQALSSYQNFFGPQLDELTFKHYMRPAITDGGFGAATAELIEMPRCGQPDYGYLDDNGKIHRGSPFQAATGSGNWQGCHGVGDFHCAVVKVMNPGSCPSHLKPVFEEVKKRVSAAYAELGLRLIWDDNANNPEIEFSFVSNSSGWIGLALIGNGVRCGQTIWCRYLASYRGQDVAREWTTLIKHELGHNCGLQHSRGGVMNPSIVPGLGISWKGDPHYETLVRKFGGQPVDIPGPGPGPQPPKGEVIIGGSLAVTIPENIQPGTYEFVMRPKIVF